MESITYFGLIVFNIFLIGSACLSINIFVFLIIFRVAKPSAFSKLPRAFREITIVASLLLFIFISFIGISEYFLIKENLYWAKQPRTCYEAPFRQKYYLQISNHRDGYLGTLFVKGKSEAEVKNISEFTILEDYFVGGSGLSSDSFFIYDLRTGYYRPGLSEVEILSELIESGDSLALPLTQIIDYCEIAVCSPCDE